MHMDLSTPYTHSPVAGAGLSLSGDTWSLSATAGASTGDFIQYNGSDWVDFDLLATANSWAAANTFDAGIVIGGTSKVDFGGAYSIAVGALGPFHYNAPAGEVHRFRVDTTTELSIAANLATFSQATTDSTISWAGATGLVFDVGVAGYDLQIASSSEVAIAANLATFNQATTDSTISWAGATGLVFKAGTLGYEFDIGGSSEVTIAANTMTLDQGAVDWIWDWTVAATLDLIWGGAGFQFIPTKLLPLIDNGPALGDPTRGFNNLYLADDGGVNFRGASTYRIWSDDSNELEIVAPNIVNVAVGSTDIVSVAATEVSFDAALQLKEQAAANSNTAAWGQIWCKTAIPNQLWFTNDAGTDVQLGLAGSAVTDTVLLDQVNDTPSSNTITADPVMALVLSTTTGVAACYYEAFGVLEGSANSQDQWTIEVQDPDSAALKTITVAQDATGTGDFWHIPFKIRGYDATPSTGAAGYHLALTEDSGGGTLIVEAAYLYRVAS